MVDTQRATKVVLKEFEELESTPGAQHEQPAVRTVA